VYPNVVNNNAIDNNGSSHPRLTTVADVIFKQYNLKSSNVFIFELIEQDYLYTLYRQFSLT
jgi:hypothetical protein